MENNKDKEYLDKLRHSAAHLLAAAVMDLYPNAKRTIGPAIDDGFYFDFDFGKTKIAESDLLKIEKKMHQLLANFTGFKKHMLSASDAKKEYPGNTYKHELIDEFSEKGKKKISFYESLGVPNKSSKKIENYWDLCRGDHVENPSIEIGSFKLLSLAGAYWRGDEKNKMLTRIYGTAWTTQKELDDYLSRLEEAKMRDHRKIGKELDLFVFSDLVGKGLPLLTEKGATIWRELERFTIDEEIKRGYKHVRTPNIAKTDLYRKSGHYPYYKDTMYPAMKVDEEELILRPMTCPHHFALYMDKPRSYRELPIRYAELANLFRYEKSGELTGLIRVRQFTLADSHNFVRKENANKEINFVIDLIEYVSKTIGLEKGKDFFYRLSLGDRENKKKYYDSPKEWDEAEDVLRKVLKEREAPYYEAKDEAAFYGPKIDVQMKNISGKEDTAFTVQYDFCLPARFGLKLINEKGEHEQPIVIHRSSVGCMERTIAFLIEHYTGAFPAWLSPVQVKILPITDRNLEYAKIVNQELVEKGIRVELDEGSETLGNKIRKAQEEKIPYMIVVGDKEEKAKKAAVRLRSGVDLGQLELNEVIKRIKEKIDSKSLEL